MQVVDSGGGLIVADIITALATVILALAAIFGKEVARQVVRPRLKISLDASKGNSTYVSKESGERAGTRWFHVNVETSNRQFTFKNAQVVLREVKEEGPNGHLRTAWQGRYPLTWRHEPPMHDPATGELIFRTRTIGSLAQADIFWIHETEGLLIGSRLPNDLLPIVQRLGKPGSRVHLAIVVRAISDEGDSQAAQFEIFWSGKWADAESDFDIEIRQSTVELPN